MRTFPILLALASLLAGCASNGPAGDESTTTYRQAGSSTVLPVAQAWAEAFPGEGARFVVSGGGTGAGFQQFCRGEIEVADASRPIKAEEGQACAAAGVTPFEVQ